MHEKCILYVKLLTHEKLLTLEVYNISSHSSNIINSRTMQLNNIFYDPNDCFGLFLAIIIKLYCFHSIFVHE